MSDANETNMQPAQYHTRREREVLVIENVASDLNSDRQLLEAFREALGKESQAIVIYLPTPKSITSVVIAAFGEASRLATEAGRPFFVVTHPKIRLLIRMFGLEDVVHSVDRLQTAFEQSADHP